ncbi:MAG: hypothetical protein HUK25_00725 [Treponema sp.]|nr:hypothetical protein [Treponema sp.]
MDFQGLIQNIKEKAQNLWSRVKDYVIENTVLSLAIGGLVLIIIVSVIILIVSVSKPKESVDYTRELTLTEELLVPPSPVVPNGYNLSRKTEKSWSNEETNKWFSSPTEKEINDLSISNDRIISEITGAAP